MTFISKKWIWIIISTLFFLSPCKSYSQDISSDSLEVDSEINPKFHQLYIVFAGPYPANPSSTFGHLFLLIDSSTDSNKTIQLWDAVNYAADVSSHSGLSLFYNGLVGNLKGNFEVVPFYKKIQDYSYAESRDLWLFPIKLNDKEKQRFSEFINSGSKYSTQYRFSDKNCATRVSEALHYAFEKELDKNIFVLPQQVLDDKHISPRLSEPLFIKNIESQLLQIYKETKDSNFNKSEFDISENTKRVKFLKIYEWLYNKNSDRFDKEKKELIQDLRYQVAQEKSDYSFQEINTQNFMIHYPARIGMDYNYDRNIGSSINVNFRLGLHDFSDLSLTYPKFDYIDLLSIELNLNAKSVIIDEFWLFHQQSRQPTNNFNTNTSWTLGIGSKNYWLRNIKTHTVGIFTGIGRSYYLIDSKWTTSFLMNINPVYILQNNWSIVFDPVIENRLFFTERFKSFLSISNPIFLEKKDIFNIHFSLLLVFNIKQNISLNTRVGVNENEVVLSSGLKLNLPY